MKNFLFTAVALLAFSGAAMAETSETKNEIKKTINIVEYDKCMDKAMAAVDLAGEDDPIFNYYLYQYYMNHC